ncbi:DUF2474 family protein [Sphingomonas sp. CFBP 13728]|nr:DUF2474 family protein [Sphingomonas sp. CFBP 13706]MBD8620861.1 DUF2474 family protein [Sphingomonas sp. CFBP 13728]MBD8737163.1 DUF2474 family protein [Sphingomonas sp. CFBP 13706]
MATPGPRFVQQLCWLAMIWTASVLALAAIAFAIRTVLL